MLLVVTSRDAEWDATAQPEAGEAEDGTENPCENSFILIDHGKCIVVAVRTLHLHRDGQHKLLRLLMDNDDLGRLLVTGSSCGLSHQWLV